MEWGAASKRRDLLDKKSFSLSDGSMWASLIAVKATGNEGVDGAVIGLSNKDYIAISNREKNYRLREVSGHVSTMSDEAELPQQEVFAFFPINEASDKKDFSSNVFVRKKYFDDISLSLKALGHKGLKKQKAPPLKEAYLIDEQVAKILNSPKGEKSLLNIRDNISRDMTISKETRSVAYSLRPLIFPKPIYEDIINVAEAAVSASTKGLHLLYSDKKLQELADYSEEDEQFLKHSIENDTVMPVITRVDLTISGNRILVLEVNADSPGGMRHLDILSTKQSGRSQKDSSFNWINDQPYESSQAVVNALLESSPGAKRAAIVEYRPEEWPTYPEMLHFSDLMTKSGVPCSILDLESSSLVFKNNQLLSSDGGVPIDLVYKRILWGDFSKSHPSSKNALSEAFLSNSVSVVNSLGSRMASNKLILALLKSKKLVKHLDELGHSLSEGELKVIEDNFPESSIWGDIPTHLAEDIEDKAVKDSILNEPYKYVLKSFHGYGGDEVLIGCDRERPRSLFEDAWGKGYVSQEYIPHGRALMPIYEGNKIVWEYQYYILGAYVINGKCVAIEAKISPEFPINMKQGASRTSVYSTK